MGLFSNRGRVPASVPPREGLAAPVNVNEGDLDLVGELMTQFERAVGSDAGLRALGLAVNRAGGFKSFEESLRLVNLGLDANVLTDRPWRWLAAVARQASQAGDLLLVGQVALFTQFWSVQVAPNLRGPDWLDGLISGPSDLARAEIFSLALHALPAIDRATIIAENHTGTLRANDVLMLSAAQVSQLPNFVSRTTADLAQQILGPSNVPSGRIEQPPRSVLASPRRCPVCSEVFPKNANVALHNLRHALPAEDGGSGYIWRCGCGEMDGVWDQPAGAGAGLTIHMQQRHGIVPM
jgi:hypothetical protein